MATVNELDCNVAQTWTGAATCDAKMGVVIGEILLPTGTTLSNAEVAAIQTTLQTLLVDNNYLDRALLVNLQRGIEDNSEAVVSFTYPDGTSIVTREEVYKLRMEHNVGQCYQKNLRGINSQPQQWQSMFIDKSLQLWGTRDTPTSEVRGFTLAKHWANVPMMANYEQPSRYMVDIELADSTELADRAAFVKLSFNPFAVLSGVQGVDVQNVGSNNWTTGVFPVTAFVACGGINMVTTYGGELDAAAAWSVTNTATGATIDITSVTQTTTGGVPTFTIDVDATDTDYPTSGNSLTIELASVSALTALGVSYYEQMTPLTLTRP